MSSNKCFVCTGDIQNGISDSDNSSSEENSILLSKILELPDSEENERNDETKKFGGRKISYCQLCLNKILNICDMLEELERLEKKVLDEKYSIELLLKEKDKSQGQNSSDQLRGQIVTELRAASIGSMLDKIRNKRVGQRRNAKGSRNIRIMKDVTIPNVVCETIQPHDQLQSGNVMSTSQDSQSQLVHQHSLISNPLSCFVTNDHLESQVEDTTSQEPPTANANMTEIPWTFDNGECDIKYEVQSDADMTIDPLQIELNHFDPPRQNDLACQISTKLEVDDLPDVTKFSDAQQIPTTTKDPPNARNFICGTCGARFVSYNQLRIHDQRHLENISCKSSAVLNIPQKKGKPRHKTTNVSPAHRPKKCEECGKVLSSNQSWTNHVMSLHRGQYKFKCTLCSYGCQLPFDLQKHVMRKHSVNNEVFKCSKCDRVFKTKRARTNHMLKCYVEPIHQNSSNQLRGQIVTDLRAASIESMLDKIHKKRVGQRRNRNAKGPRNIRTMKSVTIPKILSETVQPISEAGSVVLTLQESQSELVHEDSFLPNPPSFVSNDQLEIQVEDTTGDREEPLTVTTNMAETSWASVNEEFDIKYEVWSDSDMTIDSLQRQPEHLDFQQQNDLISQISTKLEVDELPDVTKFSDAQQTTTTITEDPPSHNNFICRTCGAGFVSYKQLRVHDRMHLKSTKDKTPLTIKLHGRPQPIEDPLLIDPLNIDRDTSSPEQSSSSIQIKRDEDNDNVKMEFSEEESKSKCASDPESGSQSHPDYSAPSFLTPKVHSQGSNKNHASSDSTKTSNMCLDDLVKWKCHECGECFQRAINLKSHMLVHNGVKPFKCNVCDKGFSQNFNLSKHMSLHAGMIVEKPFKCDVCHEGFSRSVNLSRHMRIHTVMIRREPLQCNVCMLSFRGSEQLSRHKMLHSGEKPYKCEDCEKSFRRLNALTTHKRIHTGRYKCDECEKCFSMSSLLIEHMNTHTGERVYTCDHCEKKFTASRHLNAHMNIYSH